MGDCWWWALWLHLPSDAKLQLYQEHCSPHVNNSEFLEELSNKISATLDKVMWPMFKHIEQACSVRPVERTPVPPVSLLNVSSVLSTDMDHVQDPMTRIDGMELICQWMIANYAATHPEQFRGLAWDGAGDTNGPWIHGGATVAWALLLSVEVPVSVTIADGTNDAQMIPVMNSPISVQCSDFLPHPDFPMDIGDSVLVGIESNEEKQLLMFAIMQNDPAILQCIQGMWSKCKLCKQAVMLQRDVFDSAHWQQLNPLKYDDNSNKCPHLYFNSWFNALGGIVGINSGLLHILKDHSKIATFIKAECIESEALFLLVSVYMLITSTKGSSSGMASMAMEALQHKTTITITIKHLKVSKLKAISL